MSQASALVIDQDKAHVGFVRHTLSERGYDVIAMASGDAGLKIAFRHHRAFVAFRRSFA